MNESDDILGMIQQGGVHYNIGGSTVEEIFTELCQQLDLPSGLDAGLFRDSLVERERIMTTSIGHGIAVPHPRSPLISKPEDQRIFVCFLDKPLNFEAMDGKPVYVFFVILSNGSQSHLRILSRLSYLFQQDSFRALLRKKPDTAELTASIQQYL